jgi:hypothetical protein
VETWPSRTTSSCVHRFGDAVAVDVLHSLVETDDQALVGMLGQDQLRVGEHGIDHRRQDVDHIELGTIPLRQVEGCLKGNFGMIGKVRTAYNQPWGLLSHSA